MAARNRIAQGEASQPEEPEEQMQQITIPKNLASCNRNGLEPSAAVSPFWTWLSKNDGSTLMCPAQGSTELQHGMTAFQPTGLLADSCIPASPRALHKPSYKKGVETMVQ